MHPCRLDLDFKLTFEEQGLSQKLQSLLPRTKLITIFTGFDRPTWIMEIYYTTKHLTIRSMITGAIRGTSKEKLYQELGLESLRLRLWYRKLSFFIKYLKKSILNTFSV